MSTQTGGDLNLVKPELTDDHKVTIGTDLPANFQKIDDEFSAHLAETVTYVASASRDISIAGTQTISGLPFTPKGIECMAYIPGTITKCQGYWAPNAQVGKATPGDTGVNIAAVGFIDIQPSGANYLSGVIKNVTATSFDIVWTKNATPTGTALLKFMIRGHQ